MSTHSYPLRPRRLRAGLQAGVRAASAHVAGWFRTTTATAAVTAWALALQSELTYVGDAGTTEPSGRTRRVGVGVEARVRLAPGLWADAGLNLSRGRFRDQPDGADLVPLAPTLTSTGGLTWRKKASDEVTLVSGAAEIPGAPPSLLEIDTDGTWSTASLGLTYSAPLMTKDGKSKAPMDAGLLWEGVIGSSGSLRVPATAGVRFWFRLYGRL